MSILITASGEICLLILISFIRKKHKESRFQSILLLILIIYLLGVFFVTLGNRTEDNAGETNIVLFSTFRRFFSGVAQRLREWGFPRGLKELKWIGYRSWENVVLNLLLLLPVGYLFPVCFQGINRWWKVLVVGSGLSLLIESAQLVFHRGWFDIDDIFLNTLGVLTGWVLYKQFIAVKKNVS